MEELKTALVGKERTIKAQQQKYRELLISHDQAVSLMSTQQEHVSELVDLKTCSEDHLHELRRTNFQLTRQNAEL